LALILDRIVATICRLFSWCTLEILAHQFHNWFQLIVHTWDRIPPSSF
jgi:hypothetical protein